MLNDVDIAELNKHFDDVASYQRDMACAHACDNTRQSQTEIDGIKKRWGRDPVNDFYFYSAELSERVAESGRETLNTLIDEFNKTVGSDLGMFSYKLHTPEEHKTLLEQLEKMREQEEMNRIKYCLTMFETSLSRAIKQFGNNLAGAKDNAFFRNVLRMQMSPSYSSEYSRLKSFVEVYECIESNGDLSTVNTRDIYGFSDKPLFIDGFMLIANKYINDAKQLLITAETYKA